MHRRAERTIAARGARRVMGLARLRRAVAMVALGLIATVTPLRAQDRGAAALGDLIRGLGTTARVLVMAAHPDDEDTPIITWLARGRQVETAYLSLTRGDGGQNLIGNELGEALGAIRTEELLAARRVDGGHQYFSRAYDFGFSKTAEETYLHWQKDSILGDVVRVVRAFRPHVLVAVFTGTPRDGHGHHQVSGLLAREAYEQAAADTVRFPVAQFGPPWTIAKFYRGARYGQAEPTLRFDVGEFNPLLGRGYGELSGESRSQHKSQGFGVLQRRGELIDMLKREGTRVNEATPPASETGIFDGLDTSFTRLRATVADPKLRATFDAMPPLFAKLRSSLDLFQPSASVPLLDSLTALARALCPPMGGGGACLTQARGGRAGDGSTRAPADGGARSSADGTSRATGESAMRLAGDGDLAVAMSVLQERLTRALELASGLALEAVVNRGTWASNDSVPVTLTLYNRGTRAVNVRGAWGPGLPATLGGSTMLEPGKAWTASVMLKTSQLSMPYWLAQPRQGDVFATTGSLLGEDKVSPTLEASVRVSVASQQFDVHAPVAFRFADPVKGEIQRPAAVAPAVTLTLGSRNEYAPANRSITRTVRVTLRSAARDTLAVRLALTLPTGLAADSAERTVTMPPGAERTVDVALRGRLGPGKHEVRAAAIANGTRYETGYEKVEYDHIRPQALYRPATLAIQAVDIALPPRANIAYIPGVGDNVAPMLEQLGFAVTIVEPARLAGTPLADFAAVVVGPRAFEASAELIAQAGKLNAYARNGGTVVTQYGQYEMTRPGVLPYPITLSRPAARVTIEEAPVTVLDANSPLLTKPNKLGPEDFGGWVQERALYMPSTFDKAWTPLLAMNDPNEPVNQGALLVAKVGKGTYVYTTLSLFRQLPAGNAGAARLIANLIAAGQAPRVTP